jgi:hypothetical protein
MTAGDPSMPGRKPELPEHAYDYESARTFSDPPTDMTREVVLVYRDGSHRPFSPQGVHRYLAAYGSDTASRWAYAEPCGCEVCTWEYPP